MGNRLDGKVALISGAARGQGAAHAKRFAEEGAKVILGDVRDDEGQATADALASEGHDVLYAHLDVTQDDDWKAAVSLAEERFGKLDVLVNNAGILGMPPILEETEEHWNQVVAVNQTGVFLGMRAAIPAMQRAGGGSIINTSSIWGLVGAEEYISYQATKGAVAQMSKSVALTHAGDGIRANSVCPGLVLTPMSAEEGPDVEAAVAAATPMKRGAQPTEISHGLVYLASDESSYVTGTELVIDGGFLAQ
jgi:NAD(P)-dependent dehydrogenase (short-subunit alcohol dehydrogenase family)